MSLNVLYKIGVSIVMDFYRDLNDMFTLAFELLSSIIAL